MVPFDPVLGINYTLSDLVTLTELHCPTAATTSYWVQQKVPVYRYLSSGIWPELQSYPWLRAYHGSDNAILFEAEKLYAYQELTQAIEQAGEYLRDAVACFVRDPVDGLARFGWPKYTGEGMSIVFVPFMMVSLHDANEPQV